jgi:hypothetical protein
MEGTPTESAPDADPGPETGEGASGFVERRTELPDGGDGLLLLKTGRGESA